MLSQETNDLLTRVGPGTPCGEMMRRYWQPAALVQELPVGGAPVPIRLLGEDLVLFRADQGEPGLIGLHCSHRGADLSYGRVEDGGLRCIYHGWLYDRKGRCLEQPGEPSQEGLASGWGGSSDDPLTAAGPARFHEKIRHTAYPCVEAGGLILTYMGPGKPPLVPAYPFLEATDDRRFNSKVFHECNYLQANEGNIDPMHTPFLHRVGDATTSMPYLGTDIRAELEAEEIDHGVRVYTAHHAGDRNYVRVTNLVLPDLCAFSGGSNDGYTVNWHVPIDDEHHWKYVIVFKSVESMDRGVVRRERNDVLPGYRLEQNKANRYLQNREEMRTETFSGLGKGFQAQDLCATEGEGFIQDRTQEHPGYTDQAVLLGRQVLMKAIQAVQEGQDPPHVLRISPEVPTLIAAHTVLPAGVDWHRFWEHPANQESGLTGQPQPAEAPA
ncbi:MAG TPA: Rieske 2Fe-2S domain-containing protein [Chloroflexota bacterium]